MHPPLLTSMPISRAVLPLGLMLALGCTSERAAPAPGPASSGIEVVFKLDSRLADPTRQGERWLAPPYFGANAQEKVEARARGVDATGALLAFPINPSWIPSEPGMVSVSPDRGNQVTIVVKRDGESTLKVVNGSASTELLVRAKYVGPFIQIAITRPEAARPADAKPAVANPTRKPTSQEDALAAALKLKEKREGKNLAVQRAKELAQKRVKDFAAQEGVVTLPSGVLYKVVRIGKGKRPFDGDTVRCRLRMANSPETEAAGADGNSEELTLSVGAKQGELGGPGVGEVLKLMQVGSTWQIILPPRVSSREVRGRKHRGSSAGAAYSAPIFLELELLRIDSPARIPGFQTAAASPKN